MAARAHDDNESRNKRAAPTSRITTTLARISLPAGDHQYFIETHGRFACDIPTTPPTFATYASATGGRVIIAEHEMSSNLTQIDKTIVQTYIDAAETLQKAYFTGRQMSMRTEFCTDRDKRRLLFTFELKEGETVYLSLIMHTLGHLYKQADAFPVFKSVSIAPSNITFTTKEILATACGEIA
jgi:hypothetical protein